MTEKLITDDMKDWVLQSDTITQEDKDHITMIWLPNIQGEINRAIEQAKADARSEGYDTGRSEQIDFDEIPDYCKVVQGVLCSDNADGDPMFSWPLFDYMTQLATCAVRLHELGAHLSNAQVLESLRLVNQAAVRGIIPPILRGVSDD